MDLVLILRSASVDTCQTEFAHKGIPVSENMVMKWKTMLLSSSQQDHAVTSAILHHSSSFLSNNSETQDLLDRQEDQPPKNMFRTLLSFCFSTKRKKRYNKSSL
jgi:hypothetical protein